MLRHARSLGERSRSGPRERKAGFTVVEVLLALALLAGLMTAMSQFIFSLGEIWTRNQAQFLFARHTRAVAAHVEEVLGTAARAARASRSALGALSVRELNLPEGEAVLLTFDLPAGDRLLAWGGPSPAEARCALAWRKDEGLLLYWKSRLELNYDEAKWRKVVVSPLVTAITYDCFDQEARRWTEGLGKDAQGEYLVPGRLRLKFIREGREIEECILLPTTGEGGPGFGS